MTFNPWGEFSTESVLNRIEKATGHKLTNFIMQRNSYINRVFEVECTESKERWIAKFYRPKRWTPQMILNELSFLNTLANADVPVIPALSFNNTLLFDTDDIPLAIFPKKWGRAIDELTQESWTQVGRLLGRMHGIGQTVKQSDRSVWKPSIVCNQVLKTLKDTQAIPAEFQVPFEKKLTQFIEQNDSKFKEDTFFLIHGDCHLGNLISRGADGFFIVDFDDCVIGPAIQDVWMLLPGPSEDCQREVNWFAEGYETFRDFPDNELKLIPALSIMRQLHFAAWCAIQKDEPHFHHHFQNWGTRYYWEQLINDIQI